MYNEILNDSKYDFIREGRFVNENKICLLTVGGYQSYGIDLNEKLSAIPLRGVCLNSIGEIESNKYRNKPFVYSGYDATIYHLDQFINRLIKCQPEVVNMFGVRDEDILMITEEGKLLKDNIDLFLNRYDVYRSFRGCTLSIKKDLCKLIAKCNGFTQEDKEKSLMSSMYDVIKTNKKLNQNINLYLNNGQVMIDIDVKGYSFKKFKNIINIMGNELKRYNNLNSTSTTVKKRDKIKILKYSIDIINTYLIGIDLLSSGKLNVYRGDNGLIKGVLNENYSYDEILNIINMLDKEFIEASRYSVLQEDPNQDKINELVDELNRRVLNDEV